MGLLILYSGDSLLAFGQEPSLAGSLSAGWSYSEALEIVKESKKDPFTTLGLDYRNHLFYPQFLTYRVRPRYSRGFENIFTGRSKGSGMEIDSSFLPQRPWPFTFRYAKFKRLGVISGLGSNYARLLSENEDSTLNFTGQYLVPDHPNFTVQFTKFATAVNPEQVLEQGFATKGSVFSLSGRHSWKEWDLKGSLQFRDVKNLTPFRNGDSALLREGKTDTKNFRLQAFRDLSSNTHVSATAYHNKTGTEIANNFVARDYSGFDGQLRFTPREQLQGWVQAGLTRSSLESQIPSLLVRDRGEFLGTSSANVSNRFLQSRLRYDVTSNLSVVGRSRYSQTATPTLNQLSRSGSFWTNSTGISFKKNEPSWSLNSSYNLISNLTRFERQSPGSLLGHSFQSGVAVGNPSIIRGGASFEWTTGREETGVLFGTKNDTRRVSFNLSKAIFWRLVLESRGGFQKQHYRTPNVESDFQSRDYAVLLRGPRFHVAYSRQIGSGDAWQFLFEEAPLAETSVAETKLIQATVSEIAASGTTLSAHSQSFPIVVSVLSQMAANSGTPQEEGRSPISATDVLSAITGSHNSMTSITASFTINRHMSLQANWQGRIQALGRSFPSRYEQQQIAYTWRFRNMAVEAAYSNYRFDFGSPVFRKQILFRVTRDFRIF